MKAFVVAILVMLGVAHAQAAASTPAVPWRYDIFPLNGEIRWERDATQQMVDRHPFGLAFGVRKGPSTVLFEYSKFDEKTGNAALALDRSHEEFLFWWKQNLINFEMLDLFAAGAAGGYTEKVTTTLAGSGSSEDSTGLQMMGGVSAGAQSLLFRYVLVSFEGRVMAGKNFDPNPQLGMLLRLGVEF